MSRLIPRSVLLLISVALAAVAGSPPAFAQDKIGQPAKYTITAWGAKEGAPSSVRALAQTKDGYLWLGTGTGLYKFDGVNFARFQAPLNPTLPSNGVGALHATEDGGIWIGTQRHLVLLHEDKIIQDQTLPESFGSVRMIIGSKQRGYFALTNKALLQYEEAQWKPILQDSDMLGERAHNLFSASDGTLWIAGDNGVFYRSPSNDKFVQKTQRAAYGYFGETTDGSVWYADFEFGLRRFHKTGKIDVWSLERGAGLFIGKDDIGLRNTEHGLVIETLPSSAEPDSPAGVPHHTSKSASIERIPLEALVIIPDREGNFWVGTYDGLVRLRPNRLQDSGFIGTGGIAPGADKGISLISYTRGLMNISESVEAVSEAGTRLTYIHRDHNGVLWLGGRARGELVKIEDGRITKLSMPADVKDGYVNAIAVDQAGAPWISVNPSKGGTYRWRGAAWEERGGFSGLPQTAASSLTADDKGRLWIGYPSNLLVVVGGDELTKFGPKNGIDVGTVRQAVSRGSDTLIAGEDGVCILVNGRFHKLKLYDDEFLGVSSLMISKGGDLWVNQSNGILKLARAELKRAHRDPGSLLDIERFDYRDGLVGSPTLTAPIPTSTESNDGVLWFTAKNLVHIDPNAIIRNTVVPSVRIVSVRTEQNIVAATSSISLPVGVRDFTIAYTALSLTDPDKVRFRYKLIGSDQKWKDGRHSRDAIYSNVGAGTYVFKVIASNNDGVWNTDGATIRIILPSFFHETIWFKLLCFVIAIGLFWLVFWMRSRQVAARVRDGLRERYSERERIARELHDTLLQGVQGLILNFQVIADQLPSADRQRVSMEVALDSADALMKEGRERVSDLRLGDSKLELGDYFRSVAEEFTGNQKTLLHVKEVGRPLDLQPMASVELRRIVSEAIINSIRHADASHVDLKIEYGVRDLRIDISDNGRGIDADILAAGGRPGHWGLAGMKERARKLGGELEIRSGSADGTQLTLCVPASIAYPVVKASLLVKLSRAFSRT